MNSIIQLFHTLLALAGQIFALFFQLLAGILSFFLAIVNAVLGLLHLG